MPKRASSELEESGILSRRIVQKMKGEFICQRCGKCCLEIKIGAVYKEDVDRWKRQRRKSILRFVDVYPEGDGDIWPRVEVFDDVPITPYNCRCPFILKVRNTDIYRCKIHDSKPIDCQVFPFHHDGTVSSWAWKKCPEIQRLRSVYFGQDVGE